MDSAHLAGTLVPITICIALFATIFGIYYLRSKEHMALIERGINPKTGQATPKPFVNLKYGLLLCGCGLGLLLGMIGSGILESITHNDDESPAMYMAMIAIFGGIGLILSYHIERKHLDITKDREPEQKELTSGDRL